MKKEVLIKGVVVTLALTVCFGVSINRFSSKACKEEKEISQKKIEDEQIVTSGDDKKDLLTEAGKIAFKIIQKENNKQWAKKQVKEEEFSREEQRYWFRSEALKFNQGKNGTRAQVKFQVHPVLPENLKEGFYKVKRGNTKVSLRIESDVLNVLNKKYAVVVKNPKGKTIFDKVVKGSALSGKELFTATKVGNKEGENGYGEYTIEVSTTEKIAVQLFVDVSDFSTFEKIDTGDLLPY